MKSNKFVLKADRLIEEFLILLLTYLIIVAMLYLL